MENETVATTTAAQAEQVTPENLSGSLVDFLLNDNQQQIPKEQAPPLIEKEENEVIEPKEWLTREFGTDDIAALKSEREELKTLREKGKPFEFKNDDSRKAFEYLQENKIDDLYEILSNRKKIEKLSSADLNTNKDLATELVKFGIKNDNPTLNDDEVEFLFNEKYSFPSKPVKNDFDDDDEHEAKVNVWKDTVANLEKKMVIEAKMAQPKISQLKTELVFPEIKNGSTQQNKQSQEDLNAFNELKTSFLQSAEQTKGTFKGLELQVKDKDVNYTVGYTPSIEESTFIESKLNEFAESGLDANALLADRWVNADGKSLNVNQMRKDLLRIYGDDKIDQKIASDSGNKRLEAYLKEKKQINFSDTNTTGQFSPDGKKTAQEALTDAILAI